MAVTVKTIQILHFEGLFTEMMLLHTKRWPAVTQALPDEQIEIEKLHRAYLTNVIYTFV